MRIIIFVRKERRMKKIGIPRGMLYYENFPFWQEYFEGIGCELVESPKTNKEIMDKGILSSVDEACLPVKITHGHVNYLKDKVDYIFLPRFISLHKMEYCCPKILGLPEMIINSIDDLPEIIQIDINLYRRNELKNSFQELGKSLGVSKEVSNKSFRKALKKLSNYQGWLKEELFPKGYSFKEGNFSILVLGHSYNVYDEFLNMGVLGKLQERDINIFTAEELDDDIIRKYSNFTNKRIFWTHGRRILGASKYHLKKATIDGIIYLSSFGCGLDSVLSHFVLKQANLYNVPFMLLTLDEQTGEAGFNTRLEAFLDMMKWRDRNQSHISTFR